MPRRLLTDDEWEQFWRHGSVTTFERSGNPNYDGEIREFWERQFATLREGARIVDLATGNGAVALLAAEYSAARRATAPLPVARSTIRAPSRSVANWRSQNSRISPS